MEKYEVTEFINFINTEIFCILLTLEIIQTHYYFFFCKIFTKVMCEETQEFRYRGILF